MINEFHKNKEYWGERLQKISNECIDHFELDENTSEYLTTIGLPDHILELEHVLDIHFYFDTDRIVKKELNGISYIIIGDDSGVQFGICLADSHVYAVDFNASVEIDRVCFINSDVSKFMKSIQCFVDFKLQSDARTQTESQLKELMISKFNDIDKMALASERTWWGQIIHDPI